MAPEGSTERTVASGRPLRLDLDVDLFDRRWNGRVKAQANQRKKHLTLWVDPGVFVAPPPHVRDDRGRRGFVRCRSWGAMPYGVRRTRPHRWRCALQEGHLGDHRTAPSARVGVLTWRDRS